MGKKSTKIGDGEIKLADLVECDGLLLLADVALPTTTGDATNSSALRFHTMANARAQVLLQQLSNLMHAARAANKDGFNISAAGKFCNCISQQHANTPDCSSCA